MSSIRIGGGVRASAMERRAPASTLRAIKTGKGGGFDQSSSKASSSCFDRINTAPIATKAPTISSVRLMLRLMFFFSGYRYVLSRPARERTTRRTTAGDEEHLFNEAEGGGREEGERERPMNLHLGTEVMGAASHIVSG